MLKVAVLVKQVPRTDKIKIDREKGTLIRKGVESILNPYCEYALDMAVVLKKEFKAQITALTMGPPQAEEVLKRALSLGADDAVLLSDRTFAGADCWATAYTLKKGLQTVFKEGYDIIFCGVQAIDGDTAQVPAEVAQMINVPIIPYAYELKVDREKKEVVAKCEIDDNEVVFSAKMPVLITVKKGSNNRRMPSIPDVKKAFKHDISVISAEDSDCNYEKIGLSGSPTRVVKIEPAVKEGNCEMFNDTDIQKGINKILEKWHKRKAE
jgi:electron transfer flavoprotein beta subunit